jgi:hypothetical protein
VPEWTESREAYGAKRSVQAHFSLPRNKAGRAFAASLV